ncbi:MAG: (d)CMP kinase [Gemmatimonadaceae bacterium]|nr:(d)CMP kinase [Gemmatimonadaceae bacterium]
MTIDGPAASGKSSTAQMVADALGARHVDSGALYRAITAARLREGGAPEFWTEADVLAAAQRVSLVPHARGFTVCIEGRDAEEELRGQAVTGLVSMVAKISDVRGWVNAQVRATLRHGAVVCDGRDMGTAVFPDAALKVWLVALPEERARRRLLQRLGRPPSVEEIGPEAAALEARDQRDAEQTQPAPDAEWVDGTGISQGEQVARIVALAASRGMPLI